MGIPRMNGCAFLHVTLVLTRNKHEGRKEYTSKVAYHIAIVF